MPAERAEVLDLKPLLYALLVILVEAWQSLHCFPLLIVTVAHETLAVLVVAALLLLLFRLLIPVLVYLGVGERIDHIILERLLVEFELEISLKSGHDDACACLQSSHRSALASSG